MPPSYVKNTESKELTKSYGERRETFKLLKLAKGLRYGLRMFFAEPRSTKSDAIQRALERHEDINSRIEKLKENFSTVQSDLDSIQSAFNKNFHRAMLPSETERDGETKFLTDVSDSDSREDRSFLDLRKRKTELNDKLEGELKLLKSYGYGSDNFSEIHGEQNKCVG